MQKDLNLRPSLSPELKKQTRRRDGTELDRFWRKVLKKGPDDCWVWIGAVFGCGYGCFNRKSAHRVSWIIHHGNIPEGMEVMHKCDFPLCVNPNHLEVGTHKQNLIDAGKRHLFGDRKGERNPRCKLSKEKVIEIRRLYALGGTTQTELGAMFGVTQATIMGIVNRYNWVHI